MADASADKPIGIKKSKLLEDNGRILPSNTYKSFLNYFQAVEQLFPTKAQNQYEVSGNYFSKIILCSAPAQKLEIFKQDCLYYSAAYLNNTWIELKNELSNSEIKMVRGIPQTKSGVVREYLTKYLLRHLYERFNQVEVLNQDITVKFNDLDGEVQPYFFHIDYLPERNIEVIYGKDNNSLLILKAEIFNKNTIVFLLNTISDECLLQFGNWCQK